MLVQNTSIKLRLILLTLVPLFIAGTLLLIFFINHQYNNNKQHEVRHLKQMLLLAANQPQENILSTLSELLQQKNIISSALLSKNPNTNKSQNLHLLGLPLDTDMQEQLNRLLSIEASEYQNNRRIHISQPLFDFSQQSSNNPSRENRQWIYIVYDTSDMLIEQFIQAIAIALFSVLLFIFQSVAIWRYSHIITQPLSTLSIGMKKIQQGNYSTQVDIDGVGEILALKENFNDMSSALNQNRENLQQSAEQATGELQETLETIEVQNIELDIARKQALQAAKIKSEFLANMSHEIRTPLNGIIGFTNVLLKSALDTRQKDHLDTIKKSSDHLLSIINDILDFSKIEAGKLALDQIPLNIREIIDDVMTITSPVALEKDLNQLSIIYSDVPSNLLGDPLRVKQILTNLINNAVKFTREGRVVTRVALEDQRETTVILRISVTDTGIGMTEAEQDSLFKAFSQPDPNIARESEGSGLGLAISKRLVKQMGGEIGIESVPGKGSSFWFTIRLGLDQVTPVEHYAPFPDCRAWIYDKDEFSRLAISHMLNEWHISNTPLIEDEALIQAINEKRIQPQDIIIACSKTLKSNSEDYLNKLEILTKQKNVILLNPEHLPDSIPSNIHDLPNPVTRKRLLSTLKLIDSGVTKSSGKFLISNTNQQLNVLAVDDNDANLKLLTTLLSDINIKTTAKSNGIEAIKAVQNEQFDLILMDIQMPGMNGIEASRAIRSLEKQNTHIPIIAVTAHALSSEKEKLLQSGIDDYITKPISEEQLLYTIGKWSGQKLNTKPSQLDKYQNVVDLDESIQLTGGKEKLAKEMLSMLINNIDSDEKEIILAFKHKNYDSLLNAVHKLHGATRYCGTIALRQSTQELETALKLFGSLEESYLTRLHPLVEQLQNDIRLLLEWYTEHQNWLTPA